MVLANRPKERILLKQDGNKTAPRESAMNYSDISRNTIERVYLITGWNSRQNTYPTETQLLKKCYPNAQIVRFPWDSDGAWADALKESDTRAVEQLIETLQGRPVAETRRSVLVGHSLGARIAIRTACRLRRKLHHLVLIGAAINADDAQVQNAVDQLDAGIVHLYNSIDISLHLYKVAENHAPLGISRLPFFSPKTLNISTNGLFSAEEGLLFKTVLLFIGRTLGGPACLLSLPLAQFLSSTHACQRYLIYYKNRLSGRKESEFASEFQKLGDELSGGAANFLSNKVQSAAKPLTKLWKKSKPTSPPLTKSPPNF